MNYDLDWSGILESSLRYLIIFEQYFSYYLTVVRSKISIIVQIWQAIMHNYLFKSANKSISLVSIPI